MGVWKPNKQTFLLLLLVMRHVRTNSYRATVELKKPDTSYKFSGREFGVNNLRRGMKGPENECDKSAKSEVNTSRSTCYLSNVKGYIF